MKQIELFRIGKGDAASYTVKIDGTPRREGIKNRNDALRIARALMGPYDTFSDRSAPDHADVPDAAI